MNIINELSVTTESLKKEIQIKQMLSGWNIMKDGTYCINREMKGGRHMTSATFIGAIYVRDELSVIVTERHSITFQYATSASGQKKPRQLYRIDYDLKKGWHIDSKTYNIIHEKLNNIHSWYDVIAMINKHGSLLPAIIQSRKTQSGPYPK